MILLNKNIKKVLAGAAALTVSGAMFMSAGAYTIEKGIYGVTDESITVSDNGETELAADQGNDYWYVMDIPGSAPVGGQIDTALEQNGNLWSEIDKVEVDFTLTNKSGADADMAEFSVMSYMQLGEETDWAWYDSDANPDLTYIDPAVDEDNVFEFGKKYTVTFNPKLAMDESGVGAGSLGGVLKMGLKISNQDVNEMKFDIKFSDLRIDGDGAAIAKYSKLAAELTKNSDHPVSYEGTDTGDAENGAADGAAAETETGGGSDNAAASGAKTPQGDKTSAETGAADVAVVIGIAVAAGAAAVITKRNKKS